MVNLEWYRTFRAIVEKKTLTRAAEALYASQPGVSVHLNALEAYVGKKLFERTSRKMIPTEEGKQLYNFVVEALERLEQAEQHFKKSTKETVPSLHIGMCTETFQTILKPEVSKLRFNLVAKFGGHQDLIKDLNKGLLDLVITPKIITPIHWRSMRHFLKSASCWLRDLKLRLTKYSNFWSNKILKPCLRI